MGAIAVKCNNYVFPISRLVGIQRSVERAILLSDQTEWFLSPMHDCLVLWFCPLYPESALQLTEIIIFYDSVKLNYL